MNAHLALFTDLRIGALSMRDLPSHFRLGRNCRTDKRFGHFDDLQGCDTATPEIAVFVAANDVLVRTCSWCRNLFFADGDSFILVSSSVGKQYGTI